MQYKNMLWNAFGNIVYLSLQWLVTVMVTRIAGYEDAGVLSLAMSISATFQTIALFGIRSYQVSDINKKFSDSDYVSFRLVTCIAALVLCTAFTTLNGYALKQHIAVFFFMMYRLSENFADVLHGIAQNNDRLDVAGKSFAMKGLATVLMFFAGYYLLDGLNGGLLLMAAGSWLTTIFYDIRTVGKLSDYNVRNGFGRSGGLALCTLPLCAYMFLSSAIATVPKYILEKLCDTVALGAYSSIFAPALLIQAAAGYVFNPFAGAFAQYYSDGDVNSFRRLAAKLCAVILAAAAVIVILAYFAGEFALVLIFGERIREYVYLLMPILFCTFATAYLAFFCMLEIVIRDLKGLIIGCIFGLAITVVFTPYMITSLGINGTSYGLVLGTAAACLIILFSIILNIKKYGKVRNVDED